MDSKWGCEPLINRIVYLRYLVTRVINHVLTGMILQPEIRPPREPMDPDSMMYTSLQSVPVAGRRSTVATCGG